MSPNNENLKIREDPQEGIVIAGVTEGMCMYGVAVVALDYLATADIPTVPREPFHPLVSRRRGLRHLSFVSVAMLAVYVSSRAEVMKLLELGRTLRATSSTLMNAESSRSHALLFVTVTQKDVTTLHVRRGKLGKWKMTHRTQALLSPVQVFRWSDRWRSGERQ